MKEIRGNLDAFEMKIGIVISRFNEIIGKNLLEGALLGLKQLGANQELITCAWVPGAFEIPITAQALVDTEKFDAIICLGAVIKGSTPHFDYVCNVAANGIAKVAAESMIPVIFGVLTTNTFEEAIDRSGGKMGNKGYDAAMTAVEMVSLLKQIEPSNTKI